MLETLCPLKRAVFVLDVDTEGRVSAIRIVGNPDKLDRMRLDEVRPTRST